jgi:hypothetical protein
MTFIFKIWLAHQRSLRERSRLIYFQAKCRQHVRLNRVQLGEQKQMLAASAISSLHSRC